MKKKLYIVRHGQTLFNQKNLIQGWCDSELTPKGHEQARAAKKWLEEHDVQFDYAACSNVGRTEETLLEISDLPYERLAGLREFHYGQLEGESTSKACKARDNLETYYKQFGGESKSEVVARMNETIESIMEREDVHTALLVSHGSSSFRFAESIDPKKARALRKFANCVIYEFDWEDGKFTLNDIIDEHVRELQ